MSNKLLLGPYIGSFKYEILTFIPYINYLLKILQYDDIVVSSHYNRSFLYESIPNSTFIPIYSNLTRDELNTVGYINKQVTKQQYSKISKMVKLDSGDVNEQHQLPYIKSTNTISYYQKLNKKFPYPTKHQSTNNIVFIPDTTEETENFYNDIKNEFDITVIGDMSNGIAYENVILQQMNYFDIVYKTMFDYIHNSKFVMTSCPEWALICCLQNIPLLYWGVDSSLFKKNGIYNFDNKTISITNISKSMIKHMINEINEGTNAVI